MVLVHGDDRWLSLAVCQVLGLVVIEKTNSMQETQEVYNTEQKPELPVQRTLTKMLCLILIIIKIELF